MDYQSTFKSKSLQTAVQRLQCIVHIGLPTNIQCKTLGIQPGWDPHRKRLQDPKIHGTPGTPSRLPQPTPPHSPLLLFSQAGHTKAGTKVEKGRRWLWHICNLCLWLVTLITLHKAMLTGACTLPNGRPPDGRSDRLTVRPTERQPSKNCRAHENTAYLIH
jgi:hypothetical protein